MCAGTSGAKPAANGYRMELAPETVECTLTVQPGDGVSVAFDVKVLAHLFRYYPFRTLLLPRQCHRGASAHS